MNRTGIRRIVNVDTMPVNAQVTKWGNSLAIRIPKTVATEAGFSEGDRIEFNVQKNGRITLQRTKRRRFTLEELIASIDPDNCHGETDWGPPVGKEVW